MKRLVYSPSINAWVKTDTGVIDLSPYITDCTVDRRINSVSYATLTFRNPKIADLNDPKKQRFMFTEQVRKDGSIHPMFHPMDPIIITMTRLKGRPVQVFTGYCDTTPYIQLFPGTAQLTASCTLKRLQYTYWDPALPFVREWMQEHGWFTTKEGVSLNPNAEERRLSSNGELNDSSIGFLLYSVLKEIGGWDREDVFIQGLPPQISKLVAKLYEDTAKENANSVKEFHDFLHSIIGASAYGSNAGQADLSGDVGNVGNDAVGKSPVLPEDAPDLLRRLVEEADRIAQARTHYSQEHARNGDELRSPPKDPNGAYYFDCSSFVSYVLNRIGKYGKDYAEVSGWFESNWGVRGEGKYLTVWANAGHILLEIKGKSGPKYIGTAGAVQRANPDGRGGHLHTVGWMSSYPTSGFTPKHIPGF